MAVVWSSWRDPLVAVASPFCVSCLQELQEKAFAIGEEMTYHMLASWAPLKLAPCTECSVC